IAARDTSALNAAVCFFLVCFMTTNLIIFFSLTGGPNIGEYYTCTISLVREDVIDTFIEKVSVVYESQTGIKPEFYIAEIGESACKLK
ncbi:MAG: hypothetical protein KA206_05215, partial [Paludibacter sp.]|nr:hypothetical protein [Paludibacter sp.]